MTTLVHAPDVPPEPGAAMPDALAPVVRALGEDADREAASILARADADARGRLDRARSEAREILAAARAEGEASADRLGAALLADAHREARALVLGARLRAYEALRTRAVAELRNRVGSTAADALAARLATMARDRLGGEARVRAADGGEIGIVAELAGRRLDLSGPVLVDLHLRSIGSGLEALWE